MIVKKLGKVVCRELRGHRRLLKGGDVVDASTVTEPTVTEPTGADVSGPQAFRSGSFLIQPKPDDDAPTVRSDDETAAVGSNDAPTVNSYDETATVGSDDETTAVDVKAFTKELEQQTVETFLQRVYNGIKSLFQRIR